MPDPATRVCGGSTHVTLLSVGQAPSIARAFVTRRLLLPGYGDSVDDGCVVASELVTNVLKHVPGVERFFLYVSRNEHRPLIERWDPSTRTPRLVQIPDGESGRGLHIVDSLAAAWSYHILPPTRGGGKIVWALM
jgi:hypothetical protein